MVNDYLIIGAGISGLVAAVELLRAGKTVTILEGSSGVGGLARSISFDDYVIDYGPHLFHSAHPEIINYWREFVGEKLVEKDFYSGNYQDGRVYDYPINLETAGAQYSAVELSTIRSELTSINEETLRHAPNYYEYVRGLAGNFLAQKFFTKYPEKLWGIRTQDLSARFAPRRIEIREKRLPFHSGPGRFAGVIEGGCGVLAEELLKEIKTLGGKVHFGAKIESIDTGSGKLLALNDIDGNTYDTSSSCVISTIAIDELCHLLGEETSLYFRGILLVNVVINGKDPFPPEYDWLYFDQSDVPFHRVGVQTRFSRSGIRNNLHILCCEVAYTCGDEIDIKFIEEQCISSLISLGFIKSEDIHATHSINIGSVYPGYFVGHELELNRVQGRFARYRNLYTTGSLADYAYSDLQILTAKSIDLAKEVATLSEASVSELTKVEVVNTPKLTFKFGRGVISSDSKIKPFTIAEIGLCHNGSVELCKQLIDQAKAAGFSSAKIQTYQPGRISKKSRTSRYFEETLDQEISISDFLDSLIFTKEELVELFDYAHSIDYDLFSTPFDNLSADLLNELGVPGFKISSMDLINLPLIEKVAKFQKPLILSTGMANLGEIEEAINTALKYGSGELSVLHCVSSYPCPIGDANLSRILKISNTFNVVSGFSDHTLETITPSLSLALGARVIEKHITLDKGMDGPDHNFSLEPIEMDEMMGYLSDTHSAMNGPGIVNSDVELIAKSNLRRSLYAKTDLNRGDVMTMENVVIKSPGDGISARHLNLILGKRIINDVQSDYPLSWKDFFNV